MSMTPLKTLEEREEDHSMNLQKPECHTIEHHPVWDGNYYTCSDCGLEFRSIDNIKSHNRTTIKEVLESIVEEVEEEKERHPWWEDQLDNKTKAVAIGYNKALTKTQDIIKNLIKEI